jgi:hypothetical protein
MSQREKILNEIENFPEYAITPLLNIITIFKNTLLTQVYNNEPAEDERLLTIASERMSKYNTADDLETDSISQEEMLSHFGLSQADLDNAEDIELI